MTLNAHSLVRAALALLPALCFLAALWLLDSYKLVRLRTVALVIAVGGIAAAVAYVVNAGALDGLGIGFDAWSRFGAPLAEESIKGAVIVYLIRSHRIGFPVDAALLGFAVGAGFSIVENLYYLGTLTDPNITIWVVRGFGTAILHGGTQAIFATLVLANADQRGAADARAIASPLLLAVLVHAGFNQFALPPIPQTLLVMLIVPALMTWVFMRSERVVQQWIGDGFDADNDLLALLDSGEFANSPAGQYLLALRSRFPGEVVADLLCYLRLHVELALRAKGMLMMRESGIEIGVDEETAAKLEEMRYLEGNVGPTALRTLQPLMHMSRRDLWQLYMLGK